jgi:alpha-1,2-mannosyltransferase
MSQSPPSATSTWDRVAEFVSERLWLGWAAGGALWLAWIVSLMLGGGLYDRFGQLVCTDHLAFYSAARMISDGQSSEIYNNAAIQQKQIELVGERWSGKYEAFRNPPFYALLYVPTANLPYVVSAAIWSVISLLAIAGGIVLLSPERPWRTMLWTVSFYPTFCAISYGQNTPLSFLALAVAYRLMKSPRRGSFLLAGIVAGFLAFKPTLLIGLLVWSLFDFRRLWPCLVGAAVTISAFCLGSYFVIPDAWTAFIASVKENAAFDRMDWWKHVTPRAFWRLLFGSHNVVGPLSIVTAVLGVGWFAVVWKRTKGELDSCFGAAVALTLWATPHALIYEWLLFVIPAVLWWKSLLHVRARMMVSFAVMFILSLLGPPLAQFQLVQFGYAMHPSVLMFGWIGWESWKWFRQSPGVT